METVDIEEMEKWDTHLWEKMRECYREFVVVTDLRAKAVSYISIALNE